jgi:hypothetical protein
MSEYVFHEAQAPDLIQEDVDVRQLVFYPTPDTPGRCLTFSPLEVPTSAGFFDDACNAPTGVGPLLARAGVTIGIKDIWAQTCATFEFAHPVVLDGRLQAVAVANPDFNPPRFAAFEGSRYTFDTVAAYLGRGALPLATQGYATVHDYETHLPAMSSMCPELFEALCLQSTTVQPSERAAWMKQFDSLTQLGAFGNMVASTAGTNFREAMAYWLEEHTSFTGVDVMRLAYHSENYRREVITPVVNSLR